MKITFADRLKEKRESLELSQSDIAVRLGVKPQSVNQWENGITTPRGHRLGKLASVLKTTEGWLMFGIKTNGNAELISSTVVGINKEDLSFYDGESGLNSAPLGVNSLPGFVNIPVYDVTLAAGAGAYVDQDLIIENYPISTITLEKNSLHSKNAVIVTVKGDSMEPTICDGDVILVNTSVTKPVSNKIFAFAFDQDLKVKRFSKKLDGTWLISSDNSDRNLYRDETVSHHNIENLRIIGQVVTIVDRSLI
jgi:phage repressor protein C with HTH and peptisase S24 domain